MSRSKLGYSFQLSQTRALRRNASRHIAAHVRNVAFLDSLRADISRCRHPQLKLFPLCRSTIRTTERTPHRHSQSA
jgi:hypothetical protein